MQSLVGLNSERLQQACVDLGWPEFRGRQLAHGLYRRHARSTSEMPELPAQLRAQLDEHYDVGVCSVTREDRSPDGTVKYLMTLLDGEVVEAVYLPYPGRTSVCISSQVGCPMACSFCATGTEGLARNLTAPEIADQVHLIQSLQRATPITHVVLMGMGEPLLNFDSVLHAIHLLHDEMAIPMRHITISTVGIVPNIRRLADRDLQITLAVSLHSAIDRVRSELVPINSRYPIQELLDACKYYTDRTRRRLTFEYVLLAGVNDTPAAAHALGSLLKAQPLCSVNTIPYNSTDVAAPYKRPTAEAARAFRDIVDSYGVTITQRQERGHRIAAACGQLKRSATTLGSAMRPLPMLHIGDADRAVQPA